MVWMGVAGPLWVGMGLGAWVTWGGRKREGQEDGDTETGSRSFLSPGLGQEIQTLMLPKVLPADKWASNRPFLLPAFPTPPILLQSSGDPQLPHSGQASGLGKSLDREVGGLGILGPRFRAGSVC